MDRFNKNDKVIIDNRNDIWNGKEAIVISDNEDENISNSRDERLVNLKVNFGSDDDPKYVIQEFPRYQLELQSKNENLVEKLSIKNKDEFENYFIGKKCYFLGLDYDNIYVRHEQENGEYTFNDEDLAEINYYKSLKKVPGEIVSGKLLDSFDPDLSIEDNFDSCYWDIEFDNGDFLNAVSGDHIDLIDVNLKTLSENLDADKDKDFIHDYVYYEDMNGKKICSWFFVDKISCAENIKEEKVVKAARKNKYKVYRLTAPSFDKLIIAAPKCSAQTILDEYGDCLLGDAQIEEEK